MRKPLLKVLVAMLFLSMMIPVHGSTSMRAESECDFYQNNCWEMGGADENWVCDGCTCSFYCNYGEEVGAYHGCNQCGG